VNAKAFAFNRDHKTTIRKKNPLYKAGRSEKNSAKSLKLGCSHEDGQHASINYFFSLRISRILNNNRVYGE
jgi:hypothetical protein